MKALNSIIVFLTLIALATGGYLGWSLWQIWSSGQIKNKTADMNGLNGTTIAQVNVCQDADKDEYGVNCTKGTDCDDSDRNRNTECKNLETSIVLAADKSDLNYKVGDEVRISMSLVNLPPSEKQETFQMRLDFDSQKLQFAKFENENDKYKPYITLETTSRIALDMVNIEGINNNDKIITIVFTALQAGSTDVTVGSDSRIGIVYKASGMPLKLNVT